MKEDLLVQASHLYQTGPTKMHKHLRLETPPFRLLSGKSKDDV